MRPARTSDLGLIVVAIAVAACGSLRGGGASDARRYRDAPGVALADLTAAEQAQFFSEFNELPCPCGEAHSLGACVHGHAACRQNFVRRGA